jgi:serine/threonine protein kinase
MAVTDCPSYRTLPPPPPLHFLPKLPLFFSSASPLSPSALLPPPPPAPPRPQVDIYSCAMIFWYILTGGTRPFEGIQPHLVGELTAVRGARPPTDGLRWPEMAALIHRMWAQDPAARPPAADIVARLAALAPPPAARGLGGLGSGSLRLGGGGSARAAAEEDGGGLDSVPRCGSKCSVM